MRVGGNRKAKDFFASQDDWDDAAPIQRKYNSRAAALYKDKVGRFFLGKSTYNVSPLVLSYMLAMFSVQLH